MAEVRKSGLQSVLSGELIPLIPSSEMLKDTRELYRYLEQLQDYIRRLLAGLTIDLIINEVPPDPLPGQGRIIPTNWRYDAASNKFQRKTTQIVALTYGVESAWENVPEGDQPVTISNVVNHVDYTAPDFEETFVADVNVLSHGTGGERVVGQISPFPVATVPMTAITGWHYDTTTHKWQIKTRVVDVIGVATESAWGDTPDGQPVMATRFLTNVDYSTSTHILSEDDRANVYVLEMGSATTGTNVVTAVIGDCSGV